MLGNFLAVRSSAIRRMLLAGLNFLTPMRLGLRPERGRCFLLPPLLTLVRAMTKPCLAL